VKPKATCNIARQTSINAHASVREPNLNIQASRPIGEEGCKPP